MPQPTSDTAVSRPDLGVVVSEYRETAVTGAIAPRVMPFIPIAMQTAEFPVIPKEVMLKIHNTARAMRGRYPSSDWEFEMGRYATKENGWEEKIDDREKNLYNTLFDVELLATRRATRIIDMAQEKRVADKVFNATNFTAHAVTNEWDDKANATPIDDVKAAKLAVRNQCGMLPNTLIISYTTFLDIKSCDQVLDKLLYTFPGIEIERMTSQQLATLFDVQQVLVGGAIYDSADKGQDASISDLWNYEYAMLTVCSNSPDVSDPCIGRTFLWTEETPGDGQPVVETYRAEGSRSDIVRVRHDTDERLIRSFDDNDAVKSDIAAAVSYLFSNIHT